MTSKNVFYNFFLMLLLLLNLASFFYYPFFIFYNKFQIYFNFIIALIILTVKRNVTKDELNDYYLMIIILAYGILSIFIAHGGFGSIYNIILSFLILTVFSSFNIENKKIKMIFISLLILFLFWVFNSNNYYIKFMANIDNMFNSNTVGMLAVYLAMYLVAFLSFLKIKKKYKFLISLLIIALSAFTILNVQSRGSLLTLAAFFILKYLIPRNLWDSKKKVTILFFSIIVAGLIIPRVYVYINQVNANYIIPYFNKKLFTGRELIWINFYNEFYKSFSSMLFGIGSKADLFTGNALNTHNNYLAILTNFGIIGFFLYYLFFYRQITKLYPGDIKINDTQKDLLRIFFSIMIMGYIETSTTWSNMYFLNFMCIGLAISITKTKKKNLELSC